MSVGVGVAFVAAIGFVVRTLIDRVKPPQGYVPPPLPTAPKPGLGGDFADAMIWLDASAPEKGRLTRKERQEAFNRALMIDESDVEQNRGGTVSEKQKTYVRLQDRFALGACATVCVMAGTLLLNVILDAIAFRDDWIGSTVSLLFFGVIFVATLGFAWVVYTQSPVRFKGGRLQRLEGRVETARTVRHSKRGQPFVYMLKLAGKTFEVPFAVYGQIDPQASYRLMYLEGGKNRLLSIEELG